jgi:hypothetical protein
MIENNVGGYTEYFRRLAIAHKDIGHDRDSETNDSKAGKKKFARWSSDEVVTGLRSKVGFPALLIELYEVNTKSEMVYHIQEKPMAAFTILEHAKLHDYADEERAFELTEKIAADILKQIWQDHYGPTANRCETPFKDVDFNGIQMTPVGPLFDNEFGWRVEFGFTFKDSNNLSIAPEVGTFTFPI